MGPRETENNAYANFGVTNKEHYGMLWYFLDWSIQFWNTGAFSKNQLFFEEFLYIQIQMNKGVN